MSHTIEQGWLEIEKENGKFCCEEHRQFYRMIFFCGAMTAMQATTGWDPEIPGVFVINVGAITEAAKELAAVYDASAASEPINMVRH
jgi:hypothetical protein